MAFSPTTFLIRPTNPLFCLLLILLCLSSPLGRSQSLLRKLTLDLLALVLVRSATAESLSAFSITASASLLPSTVVVVLVSLA